MSITNIETASKNSTHSKMPRQRSSSLPRDFSFVDSSLRVRYHSGHDSRQSVYPKLQASVSEVIYSNQRSSLGKSFSLLLGEARDAEGSEASRSSTDRQLAMRLSTPEADESESAYSCGPGRSAPSVADFSDSELDPQDSISNRGPSPWDIGRNWLSQPVLGCCNIHGCYTNGKFFDPKYRAWMQVVQPRVRMKCAT